MKRRNKTWLMALTVGVVAFSAAPASALQLLGNVVGGVTGTVNGVAGGLLPGSPLAQGLANPVNKVVTSANGTMGAPNAIQRDIVGRPPLPPNTIEVINGMRTLSHLIVAVAPTDAAIQKAQANGFEILRTDTLTTLGIKTVLLRSTFLPGAQALAALRAADPTGVYDFDHVYDPSGGRTRAVRRVRLAHVTAKLAPSPSVAPHPIAIGMIDGGIDKKHDVFDGAQIVTFNAASRRVVATAHGTEVASLLIGAHDGWRGAVPGATLYAADIYGGAANGGSADAVARALEWLTQNKVPVINMSLSGPPNALVAEAIKAAVARGAVIVAAVGNDGPAMPVSFPAAYEGVVAVTSVDTGHKVQLDANRGPPVMFSALGVSVRAATAGGGYADCTGTSFAAPIIAAQFAMRMAEPSVTEAHVIKTALQKHALDLGTPGRDPVYGYGYVDSPGIPLTASR